jgi:membrane fusion protein (multidrug efflux system)
MKRATKIAIPVLIVVAGYLAMMGLLSLKKEPPKRLPETRAKIVETAIVRLQPVRSEILAYGRVSSVQPVRLNAEVAGTLEQGDIPFKPAQPFSKGDLLVKVDDRQARFILNSTISDLMTALAAVLPEIKVDFPGEYQVWQDYFDSCQFDKKIASLPEAENQRIRLFLSRFNVYKLYFSVRNLEILLDKHYFFAPFNGSIVSTALRVGSTVQNGTLLGDIINLEQLEIEMPVNADDIPWIDQQLPVEFTSSEISGQWTGKITRIGSDIDTRTQTVQVYASIDDGPEASLLNGTFLEAHIPGKSIDSAFAVPPKAIYDDDYVYLIEEGKLARQPVRILRWESNHVIVGGGIANGDTLVVEIMQGVAPGMPAQSRTTATDIRGQ